MFVGGEFYPDPCWVRAEPQLNTTGLTFLNGGRMERGMGRGMGGRR